MSVCLIGDIGGTNGRFALYDGHQLSQFKSFLCAEFTSFDALIDSYLTELQGERPSEAALAVATHVSGDRVSFTNLHWDFKVSELAERHQFKKLKVLNDFTAISLAVPKLKGEQLIQIGGDSSDIAGKAKAVIGPGTGLGVSALLEHLGHWVPVQGQGGHILCRPADESEWPLYDYIDQHVDYVSAENLLSGRGIDLIYKAVCHADQQPPQCATIPEIVHAGIQGSDPQAKKTLETFCRVLGRVAGDLVLTIGARGGAYIAGGVVSHLLGFMVSTDHFRQSFDRKGVMHHYMEHVPCFVISEPMVGVLGAVESRNSAYDYIGVTKFCS